MGWVLNIIIVAVLIIGITTYVQHGTEKIKEEPIQSVWDSTKDIGEKTKDAYDKGKEIIDNIKNNESTTKLTEIGKIPCTANEDCNSLLNECNNLCICNEGSCWK